MNFFVVLSMKSSFWVSVFFYTTNTHNILLISKLKRIFLFGMNDSDLKNKMKQVKKLTVDKLKVQI